MPRPRIGLELGSRAIRGGSLLLLPLFGFLPASDPKNP